MKTRAVLCGKRANTPLTGLIVSLGIHEQLEGEREGGVDGTGDKEVCDWTGRITLILER